MSQPNRAQISSSEGNILLALHALQSGQIQSVYRAAKTYEVSRATLTRRWNCGTAREDYIVKNTRLSPIEEEVLIRNIEKLDSQGLSPSITIVRDMADSICVARGAKPVGKNWVSTFISRTPRLKSQIGRVYECQRKQCEDPEVIARWFRLVEAFDSRQPREPYYPRIPDLLRSPRHYPTLDASALVTHASANGCRLLWTVEDGLFKAEKKIATETALLQSQIKALQESNAALQARKIRKRKAIHIDHAMSVAEAQAIIVARDVVAAVQTAEEMPRPRRQSPKCSRCGVQGRTCRVVI